MPRLTSQTPKCRKHKASGQAVVTLNGRDIYLGAHGTKASKQEYDRLIGEWLANGRRLAPRGSTHDLAIVEVVNAFWKHAKECYFQPGGNNGELGSFRLVLHELKRLYGSTPAIDFGPLALQAVREAMVEAGWSRTYVNRQVGRIKQVFKWATARQLVPVSIYQALQCVTGLKKGRCDARESLPVKPVPEARIEAVRPFLSPQVEAMVDLQLLTGMRPGEVCQMKRCDIDMSGKLWLYRPPVHKTQHHGHDRVIRLGPRAQVILPRFFKSDLQAPLFSPSEAESSRRQKMHDERKTPLSCGNIPGSNRKARPGRKPGTCYSVNAYRRAICYACERAFGMPDEIKAARGDTADEKRSKAQQRKAWRAANTWHPHQLRHNAATNLRKQHGLEAAQVILGHKTLTVTQVYAEKDAEVAERVMLEVG